MQVLVQPKQPNNSEFLYVNINWDQLIFDADLLILISVWALAPAVHVALGKPVFLCLNADLGLEMFSPPSGRTSNHYCI